MKSILSDSYKKIVFNLEDVNYVLEDDSCLIYFDGGRVESVMYYSINDTLLKNLNRVYNCELKKSVHINIGNVKECEFGTLGKVVFKDGSEIENLSGFDLKNLNDKLTNSVNL